jgi:hypothetical protein
METTASFEACLAPLPYLTICGSPSRKLHIVSRQAHEEEISDGRIRKFKPQQMGLQVSRVRTSLEEEELKTSQGNFLTLPSGCKSRLIKVEQTDQ